MADFGELRAAMVERQLAGRGIRDPAVLAAMGAVPREAFVPDHLAAHAYDDGALPIAEGQTISQPYIVALMIAAAEVRRGDHVLEVGAGSGYAAAVLGLIAGEVVAIERHRALADAARARLARLGTGNVRIREGDGNHGWPAAAPFDAILVAAAGPSVPDALVRQLAGGGRLIMPVGARDDVQRLLRIRRLGDGVHEEDLGAVRFVPLVTD